MVNSLDNSFDAVIVAAGSGSRVGGVPKQFQLLGGQPLLAWSVRVLAQHSRVRKIVVVHADECADLVGQSIGRIAVSRATGGATRAQSVLAGLQVLATSPAPSVLIHDAARPGLRDCDITQLLEALRQFEGAAPGLLVADSVKRTDAGGRIVADVDRARMYRVQTPQAFRFNAIWEAYQAIPADFNGTDDLAVAASAGLKLTVIPGSEHLDKVTFAEDFRRMERVMGLDGLIRTGAGFDVHAFGPGDKVHLCGVEVPYPKGLIGHSDADAPWHALTDAILGAIADGDIGDHFPPTDPQWRGRDSAHFLRFAASRVRERGGEIINVDITIICEGPKVKPYRQQMRERTAEVLELPLDRISVKATTTEKLGFLGRGEGLAAQANVSVRL